jgi:hypothetical protein
MPSQTACRIASIANVSVSRELEQTLLQKLGENYWDTRGEPGGRALWHGENRPLPADMILEP